jgi:beta-glucosidase/6-phospho-beta-glucosidase/beta-galactosidase
MVYVRWVGSVPVIVRLASQSRVETYGSFSLVDDKNPTTRCTCIDDIGRGQVHDPQRISFMERHIAHAARAIQAGIPLHGYFAWSLMDNFEWAEGYSKRFGLVYIDYPTQERILKDSALWYRDWIASL